jgi:hypothetical protein
VEGRVEKAGSGLLLVLTLAAKQNAAGRIGMSFDSFDPPRARNSSTVSSRGVTAMLDVMMTSPVITRCYALPLTSVSGVH